MLFYAFQTTPDAQSGGVLVHCVGCIVAPDVAAAATSAPPPLELQSAADVLAAPTSAYALAAAQLERRLCPRPPVVH